RGVQMSDPLPRQQLDRRAEAENPGQRGSPPAVRGAADEALPFYARGPRPACGNPPDRLLGYGWRAAAISGDVRFTSPPREPAGGVPLSSPDPFPCNWS